MGSGGRGLFAGLMSFVPAQDIDIFDLIDVVMEA
jgi:hypothetical protein